MASKRSTESGSIRPPADIDRTRARRQALGHHFPAQWVSRTLKDAAQQRDFVAELERKLGQWSDLDD